MKKITLQKKITVGVIVDPTSFWIGLNYSSSTKRYSLNLMPCITLWVTFTRGQT